MNISIWQQKRETYNINYCDNCKIIWSESQKILFHVINYHSVPSWAMQMEIMPILPAWSTYSRFPYVKKTLKAKQCQRVNYWISAKSQTRSLLELQYLENWWEGVWRLIWNVFQVEDHLCLSRDWEVPKVILNLLKWKL